MCFFNCLQFSKSCLLSFCSEIPSRCYIDMILVNVITDITAQGSNSQNRIYKFLAKSEQRWI